MNRKKKKKKKKKNAVLLNILSKETVCHQLEQIEIVLYHCIRAMVDVC